MPLAFLLSHSLSISLPISLYVSIAGSANATRCPAGHFCPAQSSEPLECPETFYCPGGEIRTALSPLSLSLVWPALTPFFHVIDNRCI